MNHCDIAIEINTLRNDTQLCCRRRVPRRCFHLEARWRCRKLTGEQYVCRTLLACLAAWWSVWTIASGTGSGGVLCRPRWLMQFERLNHTVWHVQR